MADSRVLRQEDDLLLRLATAGDTGLILRFIRDLAEYEKLAHEVVATRDDLERTLFGPRAYAEVILAEWRGEPAGFALFFHNFSTFLGKPGLYLEDLFVTPDLRGNGIGKALLGELGRLARARDCGRLEWWVLDWNESAIGFYRSLGAEAMNAWTVYRVTGDALERLGND